MENITEEQKDVLLLINQMRNKFAHQLSYLPTIVELKTIYLLSANAFCDLTGGIEQGLEALRYLKNIDEFEQWNMTELFVQICYDLHEKYQMIGGDIEDF